MRGWLGVSIQDIDQELAKGLKLTGTEGVLSSDVEQGSPADKAGLERGDVVMSLDGKRTDSTGPLRNLVAAAGAHKTVKLEILRAGKRQTVKVELGELPGDVALASVAAPGVLSGLTLESLSPANRTKYDIPNGIRKGVVVTNVQSQGSAARVLRPGDVILEVNRRAVASPTDVEQAYEQAKEALLLLVYRNGSTLFLTLPKD